MSLSHILNRNKSNVALIIGNGINRYNSTARMNSWDSLLRDLWVNSDHILKNNKIPTGISLPEFYDVLDLKNASKGRKSTLQEDFCRLMSSWGPLEHHHQITEWAMKNDVPILTPNFENTLGKAANGILQRSSKRSFTVYYPWESYYSPSESSNPNNNFRIWHINGMQCYHQSIRLGLTHYMGSVQRARKWLHGKKSSLFSGKNPNSWKGCDSWLHIIFHNSLAIFGFELGQNEVFFDGY